MTVEGLLEQAKASPKQAACFVTRRGNAIGVTLTDGVPQFAFYIGAFGYTAPITEYIARLKLANEAAP